MTAVSLLGHAFNGIMALTDMSLSGRPFRLMHFYNPLLVLLSYVVFSAIYWAAGGVTERGLTYIYPILNWEDLSTTGPVVSIGCFVALPLLHASIWALHLLRDYIFLRNKKKHDPPRVIDVAADDLGL